MVYAIFTHESHPSVIKPNYRVRFEYDKAYETRGSFAYDTPEETKAAEEEEMSKLNSGEWVVLGRVEERVCGACKQWEEVDSLWGIVCDGSESALIACLTW